MIKGFKLKIYNIYTYIYKIKDIKILNEKEKRKINHKNIRKQNHHPLFQDSIHLYL